MEIKIIDTKISKKEVETLAQQGFGDMVKGVVDAEQGIMAVGGELHADEEAVLLENGSKQEHLWGINIYPFLPYAEQIEFDSMINIRPLQSNRSRNVESEEIKNKIIYIVKKLIDDTNS